MSLSPTRSIILNIVATRVKFNCHGWREPLRMPSAVIEIVEKEFEQWITGLDEYFLPLIKEVSIYPDNSYPENHLGIRVGIELVGINSNFGLEETRVPGIVLNEDIILSSSLVSKKLTDELKSVLLRRYGRINSEISYYGKALEKLGFAFD